MSKCCRILQLFSFSGLFLLASVFFHGADGYENFTVGDSLGWYDNLRVPKVNYQKWTAGKHFSLGDFLIFNTDKNHSVVQTYNETTYKRCDYDDADTDDTTEWSAGDPSSDASAVIVAVPLLRVGPTFFFSGDYDGEQCLHGQHFTINVVEGQGLPPSLNDSPGSPAPAIPVIEENVPDTVVPSNFNIPAESSINGTSAAGRREVTNGVMVAAACIVVEVILRY